MKPSVWLKTLAGIMALFALGHTLGTAAPHVTRGPQEAAVFEAMQRFQFVVMGYTRSYWDFYRGFALIISVQLALMAVVAWHAATLSKRDVRAALPLAITLLVGCIATLIISRLLFFGGPIVTSVVAVICAAGAVVALVAEGWHPVAVARARLVG